MAGLIERRQSLEGLQEGCLRGVSRIFPVVEHSCGHSEQGVVISLDQRLEGGGVAREAPADQRVFVSAPYL
jgi:hypothetical protein